jgi:hypothetical protein
VVHDIRGNELVKDRQIVLVDHLLYVPAGNVADIVFRHRLPLSSSNVYQVATHNVAAGGEPNKQQ